MSRTVKFAASVTPNEQLAKEMGQIHAILEEYLNGGYRRGERLQSNLAVQEGFKKMRNLIELGADVNLKTRSDFTPLLLAAFIDNLELLDFLLKRPDVNLDAVDSDGQSVLHITVANGSLISVFAALRAVIADESKSAARINLPNRVLDTPLHYLAVPNRDSAIATLLTLEGANPLALNNIGETPLLLAIGNNEGVKKVFEIAANKSREPQIFAQEVVKLLHVTVSLRHTKSLFSAKEFEVLEGLIEHTLNRAKKTIADVFVERQHAESLALIARKSLLTMHALMVFSSDFPIFSLEQRQTYLKSFAQTFEVLLQVVELGADPNMQTRQGFTPLHFASYTKNRNAWNLLIANGANRSLRDDFGEIPAKYWFLKTIAGDSLIRAETVPEPKKIKAKKEPVEEPPIVLPPAPQRWQSCLASLQASKDPNVSTHTAQILLTEEEVDVNAATTNDYTALHIAARLGSIELLKILNEKNANINAKAAADLSVLRCAIDSKKRAVVASVLSRADLELETIVGELKQELAVTKKIPTSPVALILESENFLNKAAQLERQERVQLIKTLREAYKKPNANFEEFKRAVSAFEAAVENAIRQEVSVLKEEGLSKNQLKKIRDAEKKAKKQQEELAEKRKQTVSEVRAEARKMAVEAIENAEAEIAKARTASLALEEILFEEEVSSQEDLTSKESAGSFDNSLPVAAPEFLPAKEQMKKFLCGPRQINCLQDLPQFLQPALRELLQNSCQVTLKGSAVYLAPEAKRKPGDLDLEVKINGIGSWSDKEIVQFVDAKFGLKILPENIFRRGGVFTLNVKDSEKKLDWSFYDQKMLPPRELSWATNCETKIFFTADGQALRQEPPAQLQVNPQAHGLILRLCFLETIGHINKGQIEAALGKISPADLLLKELKLDRVGEKKSPSEIILNYAKSHSLDENEQKHFVENLSWMLEISRFEYPELRVVVENLQKTPPQQISSAGASKLAPESKIISK
ncbi:MAG: hypothetical protein KA100_00035 [Rickettsiales bacterium]|nr:hypothetical protein [Rickettsiales bacterium]